MVQEDLLLVQKGSAHSQHSDLCIPMAWGFLIHGMIHGMLFVILFHGFLIHGMLYVWIARIGVGHSRLMQFTSSGLSSSILKVEHKCPICLFSQNPLAKGYS